jgi:hypothetical protein
MELWSGVRIAFPQAVMMFLKVSEASKELLIFFFIFRPEGYCRGDRLGCIKFVMILYATDSLFAWNRLDDSPDLKTIRHFFESLPDRRAGECE